MVSHLLGEIKIKFTFCSPNKIGGALVAFSELGLFWGASKQKFFH